MKVRRTTAAKHCAGVPAWPAARFEFCQLVKLAFWQNPKRRLLVRRYMKAAEMKSAKPPVWREREKIIIFENNKNNKNNSFKNNEF